MKKVEEQFYCEIEAFPKQIKVSVAISKAGKTFIFLVELNTNVNAKYYCNILLKKMIPETNRLAKHNENLFMQDRVRARTANTSLKY